MLYAETDAGLFRLCHNLVYCELLCCIFSYGMVVLGELNKLWIVGNSGG